ncbi:reverse transcriptase domain-containing protein [Shewanella frigidimarina]|uniref:reverse transcriptase domain-containing protein n=1 Tax=Shewanella frigidimarina TaxID=56812 RepID=UPI003D7BEB97
MKNITSLENLANKLHELFVMNQKLYAVQLDDGSYKTTYSPIYPAVIAKMLDNKGSLLTYQESEGYVRWVCLDFDVKKEYLSEVNIHLDTLVTVVEQASDILKSMNIDFLLEHSGNRGIHIWVVFKTEIIKSVAYNFVSYVYNKIGKLPKVIGIDLFPKVGVHNKKSKGIGLGVKIPLSLHKKSNCYSYFLENITLTKVTKLDSNFIKSQTDIVDNYNLVDFELVNATIDFSSENEVASDIIDIKTKKAIVDNNSSLDSILGHLAKCNNLQAIINDYRNGISNNDRLIIVGLLTRLKKQSDPNFSKSILIEFFSRLPGYDELETLKRLSSLNNLYPLSCSTLKKKFKSNCDGCSYNCGLTPLSLIPDIEIVEVDKWFHISESIFMDIKSAQINYINTNDEVPLFHYKGIINNFSFSDFSFKLEQLITGNLKPQGEYYSFTRKESPNKTRELVSLSPADKLLSTASIGMIHNIWYDTFFNNSYGYRLNHNCNNGWIFEGWLSLWKTFINNIKEVINDEGNAYDDYQLIKIDLKNFYGSIDHQRLKIKILDQPIEFIKNKIESLSREEKSRYENIISYMFSLIKLYHPNTGLPQGPAFSRYLSEIYLLGLDELICDNIKKGHEFYFRYVDDIFIFVQNENRENEIYSKVIEWISLNGLELNHNKSLRMSVKEFKDNNIMDNYSDDNKYSIDQTTKHFSITTGKENDRALEQAKQLLAQSELGLKDDFRFVFTKFKEGFELDVDKSNVENQIITSEYGRGSMYSIFFDTYFFKKTLVTYINEDEYNLMSTLAKECYLNSLLKHSQENKEEDLITHIKHLIKKNSSIKLSSIERLSIFQLALNFNLELDFDFINKIEVPSLISVLASPVSLRIPEWLLTEDFFSLIFPSSLNSEEFINNISKIIYKNEFTILSLAKVANYFWIRSSENKYKLFNLQGCNVNAGEIYNLLSLFSLVVLNINNIKDALCELWRRLFIYIDSNKCEITQFNWFEIIPSNEISQINPVNITTCITLDQEGGLLESCNDKHNLLDKFREIILTIERSDNPAIQNVDTQLIEKLKKNDEFIKWIYDNDAKLYPTKEICLSNIALNNTVVMNKGHRYLVKSLDKKLGSFDYLLELNHFSEQSIVTFLKNSDYKKVGNIFSGVDFNNAIKDILKLHESGVNFQTEYNTLGFPNYFMPDSHINNEYKPCIPYYANGNYIFPSCNSRYPNDTEAFSTLILGLLYAQKIELLSNKGTSFSFIINNINEQKMFPKLCDTNSKKIDFLKCYIKNCNLGSHYFGFHSFENAWALSLWDLVVSNGNVDSDKLLSFFEIYLYHHNNSKRSSPPQLYHLILNAPCIPDEKLNLDDFFNFVSKSIALSFIPNVITLLKSDIIHTLNDNLEKKIGLINLISASELTEEVIAVTNDSSFGDADKYKLAMSGVEVYNSQSSDKCYILDYGKNPYFHDLTKSSVKFLKDERITFVIKLPDLFVIVLIPREIQKIYESINTRYKWLNEATSDKEDVKLLYNYENDINDIEDALSNAASIVKNHYLVKNDIGLAKDRVANWLLLFNQVSLKGSKLQKFMDCNNLSLKFLYETILIVLSKHIYISTSDISTFGEYLNAACNNNKSQIFTLKDIQKDKNGLQHLISETGASNLRNTSLNNCFENVVNLKPDVEEIVILCEVGISGTELKKALDFYFRNSRAGIEISEERRACIIETESYFPFDQNNSSLWSAFKSNFCSVNKVVIVAALVTEKFKNRVENIIKELFNDINRSNVLVEFRVAKVESKFNFNDFIDDLPSKKVALFMELLSDIELLKSIFEDDWVMYSKSIKITNNIISNSNMVLRLQSTPKGRFRLFTMKPKSGTKCLLDRRLEHKELI